MKAACLTLILVLIASPIAIAQQDPEDPGIQDSLILGSVSVDSGAIFASVQIFAVTDDSVMFYNLPLRWYAPLGGVHPGTGTFYYPPLTSWDVRFDTVVTSENFVRQIGWADIYGDTINPNPPLLTDGLRLNAWTLRFVIDPGTHRQLIVIDTCYDAVNGQMIIGLEGGLSEITPAFQRGFIAIGPGTGADEQENGLPDKLSLSQNYPNPFNSSTLIKFSLPEAGRVEIVIYDLLGRKVKSLVEQDMEPGYHSIIWNGDGDTGVNVPSGVYFCRLINGPSSELTRMTLLR